MKAIQGVLLGGLLLLASLGIASAQSGDPAMSGGASSTVQSGASTEGQNSGTDAAFQAIRDRAKSASPKARATTDKKLTKISGEIDTEANAKGKATAAGRVAPEFGMTGDALVAEADQFGAGLGEIIIAHTLLANSKTTVTMDQLFALRKDGMGWGQIAQGMDLRLGEVVSAVMSEGKVAQGTAKADGKTAMIHSASTHANTHAGLGAGMKAGHAGAAGSVGVGAKVGK
jgi:hypothetical protein